MFVSKKRYEALGRDSAALYSKCVEWQQSYLQLLDRYEKLEESSVQKFSAADLKRLRRLCHPDKHGNSEASNEMTAKLNKLLAAD